MRRRTKKVALPDELYRVIEGHLAELGASSVDEYVARAVREDLRAQGVLPAYTPEEEREVERRLRDLGYLD